MTRSLAGNGDRTAYLSYDPADRSFALSPPEANDPQEHCRTLTEPTPTGATRK